MKRKNKLSALLSFSFLSFGMISSFVLGYNANQPTIETIETAQTNFDLGAKPVESSVVWRHFGEVLLSNEDGQNNLAILNNESVLSTNTINTVRSADYYFNFINDPSRNDEINIIAIPTNGIQENIIVVETQFNEVEDSAIFFNNNLVFVGTMGVDKILVNYRLESKIDELNNRIKMQLVKKNEINVTNLGNNPTSGNIKYAISPISQLFQATSDISFIVWPMGASIKDLLLSEPNEFLKEVSIDENGNLIEKNIQFNFNFSSISSVVVETDEIVSLNALRNDNQNENNTKFIAITRNDLVSEPIKVIDFGQGTAPTVAYDAYNRTVGHQYQAVALDKIMPYAMVRLGQDQSFNLFWISQNGAIRSTIDNVDPDNLIEVNVILEENKFVPIQSQNVASLKIKANLGSNVFAPQIEQISYPLDNGVDNSNIAIRMQAAPDGALASGDYGISNPSFSAFKTGFIPVFINNRIVDNSLEHQAYMEKFMLNQSAFSSMNKEAGMGLNYMATIANGLLNLTGYYQWVDSEINLEQYFISSKEKSLTTFFDNWNTSLAKSTVVLPSASSNDFVGIANGQEYQLPIEIAVLDFAQNQLPPHNSFDFLENSILWYARYFIDDLWMRSFRAIDGRGNMVLNGEPIYRDENGNVTNKTLATQAQISVTVINPLTNGGGGNTSPITFSMNFVENPKISSDEKFVKINNEQKKILPSSVKSILEIFLETKVVAQNQSVIGKTGSNALFEMNAIYLNNTIENIVINADDFLGKMEVEFTFKDEFGYLYTEQFSLSGFQGNYIYIPIALAPVLFIAIVVVIIIIVLNYRNKKAQKISKKVGLILSSRGTSKSKVADLKVDKVVKDSGPNPIIISSNPEYVFKRKVARRKNSEEFKK